MQEQKLNATPASFGLANPADRFGLGRATTGPAVEMIGGQAVPVGDVLGRQMALEKADFFEPSKHAVLIDLNFPLKLITPN